jgi:soluble lytic murein transglycosylase
MGGEAAHVPPQVMMGRVTGGLLAIAACGCHSGHASDERLPAQPGSLPNALPAPAASAGDDEGDAGLYQGMPRLAVVLNDARLAAVREREQAHDWSGAAMLMDAARASTTLDGTRTCAWAYVAARLHLAAGETSDAAGGFERVSSMNGEIGFPCALAPYAALHEAQALVRLGRCDEAIARARLVGDDIAAHDEAQLVLADAYVAKGDRAQAVPIWRALLSTSPHGIRWVDSAVQLAVALLDGVDGPPERNAREVFDLATRVLVEAPAAADRMDMGGLRGRASSLLPSRPSFVLTPEERAQQAQAWLEASQPKRATEAADALLKVLPRSGKEHRDAACKAAIVRAQARPRGKAEESADAWGAAIARCSEGLDDALVTALYYGGKASVSAHRPAEALERFGKVEKLFPKHRLADDACFRAALVACDEGDESRGLSLLSSLPDNYPEGDMGGEALFRVALAKLGKRDLDGARDALDRLLGAKLDGGRTSAGRGAYFRARVAQLAGEVDDAQRRYTAIVDEQPLGYYMLLAYSRLRAMSEEAARSAMEAGVMREPAGPLVRSEHAELASQAFERFVRLLEVGEIDSARREAHSGGLVSDGVDSEVLWTVAWAYDRAGAPELGHSLSRTRLVDYREHWPAGRWRLAWQVAFPRVWEAFVARESEATHVPAPLTWAVMREESAFNPDARSVADAIGLMQLIAPTARATARGTLLPYDEEALRRPEISIALGTRLLSSLRASFPATPALAIAAYNGGTRAVRRWLGEHGGDDFDVFVERIPFEETRTYIKRVLASQAAYAYLYAPAALAELLALPMRAGPDTNSAIASP